MFQLFGQNKQAKAAALLKERSAKKNAIGSEVQSFRAVKIISLNDKPCSEIESILDSVYLCSEAPILPIANCSKKSECQCRYKHLHDRRLTIRRETDHGLPDKHTGTNRRLQNERRVQ